MTDATLGAASTTQRGSARWMAPELHDYQLEFKHTKASDVYAFACLCIEVRILGRFGVRHLFIPEQIYTGEQPFWNIKQELMVALQILNQKRPPRPSSLGLSEGTRAMSDRLWTIVQACWAHGPSDRPDMDKVLELIMSP
jgi:serine/threonine protein kinase